MAGRDQIVEFCASLLQADGFDDYCPNGLQIEGREDVARIVTGVTASLALIEAAIERDAEMILVHHGYFWRGEPQALVGMKGRRVRALMTAGISLLAYHLPLDAHPQIGNNRQLGERLGLVDAAPVEDLLWGADLAAPQPGGAFGERLARALGRAPLRVGPQREIRRVAWCTGAAQGSIERAAALGFDAFISGEISEQTLHQADELDICYFAAGHHATERFGVQALGQAIAREFGVDHQFVDLDNPA